MICKNCSAQIPDGSKFCTACGHKIVVEPFVASKPQQPPQTQHTQTPLQAQPTQVPPQVQPTQVPPQAQPTQVPPQTQPTQEPPQTTPTQVPPQPPYTQIPSQVQQGQGAPYNLNDAQQQTVSKNTALDAPLTVLDFFLMSLLSFVPIIGFIFLLIWAFSGNTNINRKNYARAALIWILVSIGLVILLSIIGGGILNSMM